MKVSLVTRYPYLWHKITVTDDVNLKKNLEKIAAQFYLAATVNMVLSINCLLDNTCHIIF
jgi:hypothetical protein